MLLILTNSKDATADYLEAVLQQSSVRLLRFDTDTALADTTFRYQLGAPALCMRGNVFSAGDFTNIWYRRPERLKGKRLDDSPEGKFLFAEWAEALEGFLAHVSVGKWMNHPARNVAASHKLDQLTTVQTLGFAVPDTLVTQDSDQLRAFFDKHQGQIIAKSMSAGYVERGGTTDSLIYTNLVRAHDLEQLDDLATCPTLFQQYVDKVYDVRITVVDEDIHAAELRADDESGSQRIDIRRNNMEDVAYQATTLPVEIAALIRNLVSHYRLRFAAIDMAVDRNGVWWFFEINPNGQWAWLDLAGAMNIAASFAKVFRG